MIKAGALLYAMFLVIVITIISSSFILVNYYNNSYILKIFKEEQLFSDVNSGINYSLSNYKQLPFNTLTAIDLFDDEQHKVSLSKKTWGAFYTLSATSNWKNKSVTKSVLVGANINEGEKVALYLAEQNKPLSLTGKTIIQGNCYLPKSGVKRAYIEGKSFVGKRLINGLKLNSNKSLPEIDEELIQKNQLHFTGIQTANDSLIDYELLIDNDSIINSFKNKTLVLYSPLSINISNKVIEGNIIIKSDREIIIQSSTSITNALLYANTIIVEEKVVGSMQLFAKESINIKEKTNLKYPSVVGIINKEKTPFSKKLRLEKNVTIKGAVFLYTKHFDKKNQSIISIEKDSKIVGQIYSSELLELKGKVIGGVYCKKLYLKTNSSIYENHLIDATINREELSDFFVGVPLTEKIEHQKIIKWLN